MGRAPGTQDYVSGNNVPGSIFGDFELDGSTDDAYTFIDPEYVPFRLGNKSQISVGACTGSQLCLAIEPPPGPPDSGFQVLVLDFDLPR